MAISPSKNKVYRRTTQKQYLNAILARLKTEYIPILEMITEYNKHNEPSIGYWSLIRMIFPVIETVATVIGKQKELFLNDNLSVPFGHLVWEIYRHSLMHTEELRYAVYKETTISWSASIDLGKMGHFVQEHTETHPRTIHINISKLYYDLKDFLVNEIINGNDVVVNIEVGLHIQEYNTKLHQDLEKLYNDY